MQLKILDAPNSPIIFNAIKFCHCVRAYVCVRHGLRGKREKIRVCAL